MTDQDFSNSWAIDPVAEKEEAERKRLLALQRQDLISSLSKFLETRGGRRWMLGILDLAHTFETSFHENPHYMAFREGERNIGLRIIADLQDVSADMLSKVLKERENG